MDEMRPGGCSWHWHCTQTGQHTNSPRSLHCICTGFHFAAISCTMSKPSLFSNIRLCTAGRCSFILAMLAHTSLASSSPLRQQSHPILFSIRRLSFPMRDSFVNRGTSNPHPLQAHTRTIDLMLGCLHPLLWTDAGAWGGTSSSQCLSVIFEKWIVHFSGYRGGL